MLYEILICHPLTQITSSTTKDDYTIPVRSIVQTEEFNLYIFWLDMHWCDCDCVSAGQPALVAASRGEQAPHRKE